jgi:hypothetical protein
MVSTESMPGQADAERDDEFLDPGSQPESTLRASGEVRSENSSSPEAAGEREELADNVELF